MPDAGFCSSCQLTDLDAQLDVEEPSIKFHLPLHMGGTRTSRRINRYTTTEQLFDKLEDATKSLFDATPIPHQKLATPSRLREEQYDSIMGALYENISREGRDHQRAQAYEDEMVL